MNPYIFLAIFLFSLVLVFVIEVFVHIRTNREIKKHIQINNILISLFDELVLLDDNESVYSKVLKFWIDIFPTAQKGNFVLIDEENQHQMHFVAVEGYTKKMMNMKLTTENNYLYRMSNYNPVIIKHPGKYIQKIIGGQKAELLLEQRKGINQTLATPIYGYGRVCGILSVDSFGKDRLRSSDIRLIKYFIARISYLLEYFSTKSKMDYHINIDSLTNIHSRKYFLEILERIIAVHKENEKFALIFVDIDNFKHVNDTYGHIIGDEVLADFGHKLSINCQKNNCICGRLGGDEFGIISKNCDKKCTDSEIADLRQMLKQNPHKNKYPIDISYGVVLVEGKTDACAQDLLNQADILMYQNKKRYKNSKLLAK